MDAWARAPDRVWGARNDLGGVNGTRGTMGELHPTTTDGTSLEENGGVKTGRASCVGREIIGEPVAPTTPTDAATTGVVRRIESFEQVKYPCLSFSPKEGVEPQVKGRLRENIQYWRDIGTNSEILHVIEHGYSIPFISVPPAVHLSNNRSALAHSDFVVSEIFNLISTGRVMEVFEKPAVINPLTVSVEPTKKRLILDCRHINKYIFKEHVKFDDWKVMLDYVRKGGYMFKFDIKQGYHHIEINSEHTTFLGFSWVIDGVERYFVYLVLAFGISSAPRIFTKVMRCLIKYWRSRAIKIACYIDDGAGFEEDKGLASWKSDFVRESLLRSGFVANIPKSVWDPVQSLVWLGFQIDLVDFSLRVTDRRAGELLALIDGILLGMPYTTARRLSSLAGTIISTNLVLGDITRLKTRHLYRVIESAQTWDGRLRVNNFSLIQEIIFWKFNFGRYNKRFLSDYEVPFLLVASDASDTGIAAHVVPSEGRKVAYRNLSVEEEATGSTERELLAVVNGITGLRDLLKGRHVIWQTDNYAASIIVGAGSAKPHLHELAEKLYNLCEEYRVVLRARWIPREWNEEADALSKAYDYDDWVVSSEAFGRISDRWGPFTIDRFASAKNSKLRRFNSKFYCEETEHVDALSISWAGENNYVVPPVTLVSRVLMHMRSSACNGLIFVPRWPSAAFWPFLVDDAGFFRDFVVDYLEFHNRGRKVVFSEHWRRLGAIVREENVFLALKVDFSVS